MKKRSRKGRAPSLSQQVKDGYAAFMKRRKLKEGLSLREIIHVGAREAIKQKRDEQTQPS